MEQAAQFRLPGREPNPRLQRLSEERLAQVQEIRRQDLTQLRTDSLVALIPLTFFSFGTGYILAGRMLRPLEDLKFSMQDAKLDEKPKDIKFETDPEIQDILDHYNLLRQKIYTTFQNQEQFIEDASHQLNTPLTRLKLIIESELEGRDACSYDSKHLIQLDASVDELITTVESLKRLANSKTLVKTDVDLTKLLHEIHKSSIQRFNDVEISLMIDDNNATRVRTNPEALKDILLSIIENSVKYRSDERELKITISLVSSEKTGALITIADNGIGISEKDLPHIYSRLYRSDNVKSKVSGSGIGLAIAKKFATELGHTLKVKSTYGKGTEFTLEL